MFASIAISALVASASIASARPIACRGMPTTYAEGYLENYDVYHARYIALGCSGQQTANATFFDDCCHPLLANETLEESRPSYCIPSNATVAEVSSTFAEYTSTATAAATASADVAAAAEYSAANSSVAAEPTTTVAAVAQVAQAEETTSSSSSSSTEEAWTSTSSAAAEQTSAASSSGSGETMTGGYATYFYQGGNAGACGTVHSDSDKVIAIDSNGWWQDFSQPSQYCGKYITITNSNNGKTVTAMVADVCPTCVSDNSLDLSVGAFTAIAEESEGSVPITWQWA
ncbi:hypothetical protein I317_02805 [Kwoniella heveanensis CBS 569]|nr:hypothetical protein I317_02805 [Kwoniella heveanensis CBS 569]